jgi:DNA topoisomerase III
MTSVLGHIIEQDFEAQYRKWNSCRPGSLFDAPIVENVANVRVAAARLGLADRILQDKKGIAENIKQQARYAKALFIWTDCDREGEHIGTEVWQQALKGNARLEVKRARFSNTERQ